MKLLCIIQTPNSIFIRYVFEASKLGEYHDLNKGKGKPCLQCAFHLWLLPCTVAREAMVIENTPVVIDNTNTSSWEMKPYVEMVRTHPLFNVYTPYSLTLPLFVLLFLPFSCSFVPSFPPSSLVKFTSSLRPTPWVTR